MLKVGFDIIQKSSIKNESFNNLFMVFDNFTEPIKDFEMKSLNNGPLRINTIIVAFCTEGFTKFRLGAKSVNMHKNMLTIIRPDQIIETTEISPDFKVGFIILERNFFEFQHHYTNAITLHNFFMEQSVFHFSEEDMKEYLSIYKLIKKKIEDKTNIYLPNIIQNMCQMLFYNLCNLYFQNNQSEEKDKKNNANEIHKRFIQCIESNYRKEHSVKYYADVLCLTPKYLSKVIYEVSGKHAAEWIQELIILEARALLKSSKMSLEEISDLLNFPSQSHFGRFFKRYTGYPPRVYRSL